MIVLKPRYTLTQRLMRKVANVLNIQPINPDAHRFERLLKVETFRLDSTEFETVNPFRLDQILDSSMHVIAERRIQSGKTSYKFHSDYNPD
ncbi:hypothetical protein ACFSJY_19235 [Thalassotalea euphylliae]|uniref:hypothetical protein n=1 Tax=Thalassotalea euphylliae TaxID=1655234 RepID=UPI00362C57A7